MSTAILFDLDGTLIDNSMETFLPPYFSALTKKLAHLVAPEQLIAQLHASTRAMVTNADPTRTLADTFAADFFPRIGVPRETLMPLFDDFYAREYRDLRAYVNPIPAARQVVSRAFAARWPVVIATMPVFPLVAVQQRLVWGKLADFEYTLITAYENMRASKPNPAYYREIAEKIGHKPEDCIMVGNEVQNDILPAKRVGMKTFWVTNAAFMATDVPTDWRGTLAEFGALLERGELDAGKK
ncbi:MAG: HAD family hydrolase [Anaerolineales bacterium]|nr:HAD family hydrolase [Anaerolineales bacterium]